jgi:pimeloyl-ACP methyl ester carboxylesterase
MFSLTYDFAPRGFSGQTVVVMLPGAEMRVKDFCDHGLVHALHHRAPGTDAVMVDINVEEYVSADFGRRLRCEVIEPLRERRYQHVWLAGISLGAYGAIRLLQDSTEEIAGMLLLSPFLATRGTVAHVLKAGGLDLWSPLPEERMGDDAALLCWLKDHLTPAGLPLQIFLGWGADDRYADAGRLLAARLPRDQVFRLRGNHDWLTWNVLWHDLLAATPFAVKGRPQ